MGSSTKRDEVPIEDYVCLALYAASRAVTGLYRDLLGDLGLTYPQYLVMRLLWQRGGMQVKEIGDTLELDYGTLSPLLKRLEQSGFLRRIRRTDDERSVQIELTDNGSKLRRRAEDVPDQLMCALGLDDNAAAELRETLKQILGSLKQTPG